MIQKFLLVLYARLEETIGTVLGTILGVIAHRTFADILLTCVIALLTGFLGAAGTYLFKLLKAKFHAWKD